MQDDDAVDGAGTDEAEAVDGAAVDGAADDVEADDVEADDVAADDVLATESTAADEDARAPAVARRRTAPPVLVAGAALHPLLVTVPIGAFVCAVAFDVASHVAEGYVYARGALWLLAIGLVAAVVAGAVGLVDSRRRAPTGSAAHGTATRHLTLNGVAWVLFLASLLVRRAQLDELSDGTPWLPLAIGVVALLVLVASGLVGGRLDGELAAP